VLVALGNTFRHGLDCEGADFSGCRGLNPGAAALPKLKGAAGLALQQHFFLLARQQPSGHQGVHRG
jgi:hypothetical protein